MLRKNKSCEQCGFETEVNDINLCDDCEDKHADCREGNGVCEDCASEAIDRAMDAMELQRDYDEGL